MSTTDLHLTAADGYRLTTSSVLIDLRRQYTIVIVTHNMQQAARISDQTAFFLLGEMVECAPTKTLFDTPTDPRTRDYITGRFG